MNGVANQVSSGFELKLTDDIGLVGLNGLGGNEELSGNLFIGVAQRH